MVHFKTVVHCGLQLKSSVNSINLRQMGESTLMETSCVLITCLMPHHHHINKCKSMFPNLRPDHRKQLMETSCVIITCLMHHHHHHINKCKSMFPNLRPEHRKQLEKWIWDLNVTTQPTWRITNYLRPWWAKVCLKIL